MIIRFSMRTLAVILFLLTLFICEGIFAQDDKPIRSYFSEDDLKKLVKAEKYKADADKFSAETNKLNLEIINIQAETGLSEKSIAKKVKDLENKSIQNQIAASELFEKSNEIRFTVYKKNIDDLRKKHSENDSEFIDAKLLEEQAGDNYFQAASYRIEAKKLDGYAKIEKLNEAAILEEQAIQKQLSVLYQYLGISQLVSDGGEVAESTAEITINQEMIDSYNRYMASGQLSDSTLSTGKIAAVTTFDPDRLLNLWYDYMYGLRDSIDSNVRQELTMTSDEVISNSPAEPEENLIGVGETKKEEETSVSNDKAGDVIYRVQIAANRSELSQRTLSKIYYGTKNVEVTNEDGWYKYTVGDFATYDEASDFKKSSGISNAFVVAYNKGSASGREIKSDVPQTHPEDIITSPKGLPSGLIFRVQIGASRVPFRLSQVSKIYSGNYPVEVITEDGWYKCQILGVRLYSDARRILSAIGNSGYIVAYEDGRKIELAEAIAKNRQVENSPQQSGRKGNVLETEFHVQIAASKNPVPESELAELYKGPEPVCLIFDEGWYKYHLKAGNSYKSALELKQNCNVTGAFIIAYVRAVKTNNYRASAEINE